ncbi:hypothetical protein ACHAWU_000634 [Discostella pseudostelligera]|jgi:shikimate kinase|uniref:Shikimate kinase n=1 Tax=Discostella pseudostelligera TaxID=259834 RepID=A0ABD3MDH4_9STRA
MLPQITLLLLLLLNDGSSTTAFSFSPSSTRRHVVSSSRSSLHHQRHLHPSFATLSTPVALRNYSRLYAGGFEWIDPTEEDQLNDPGVANPYKNPSLVASTSTESDATDSESGDTPSLVVDPARLLAPRLRGCNIYLIGMMGSGKSAVGDAIARRMGTYNFLDTDTILERAAGTTISQMFESSGEEEFRIAESQVLDAVHAHVRLVIGTGGGIVIRNQNWSKLRTGLVVYLRVEPNVIAGRLLNGSGVDARPLLRNEDSSSSSSSNEEEALIQKLTTLISERRTKYEQADVIVDIKSHMDIQTTADAVIKSLHDFIDENPPAYVKAREKARSEGIDWV